MRRSIAPVNAPFSWPNSSLSSSCGDSAAQCTATNFCFGRPLSAWIACATSSLPVPLSPWISTVARVGATCLIVSKTSCITATFADQPLEPVLALDLLLQLDDFLLHLPAAQRPVDQDFQPVDVQRLGDEIVRAALHRLDRRVHRAVGRHHDDDRRMRQREDLLDERHPILAAEPQIGQHEIDRLALEHAQRPADIRGHIDLEAVLQRRAQPFAGVLFVVNDEDGRIHGGAGSARRSGAPCLARRSRRDLRPQACAPREARQVRLDRKRYRQRRDARRQRTRRATKTIMRTCNTI